LRRFISVTSHLGLIIPCRSGVYYSNQCGGYACYHPKVEGVFFPINLAFFTNLKEEDLLDDLDKVLGLQSRHRGWCNDGITEEDADKLDALFVKYGLPLMVDRTKLDKSVEAWIHVKVLGKVEAVFEGFEGMDAIFVYPNSD